VVFSKIDAVQNIPLSAPAIDVAFIGDGILGYIAGGSPAGGAFLPTCGPSTAAGLGNVSLAAQMLRPLPDGQSVLALSGSNLQTVTASITPSVTGPAAIGLSGCPAPRGLLNIANTVNSAGNLVTSAFTPSQFFLSPDGSTAYILGAPSLPFVIQFNLASQTAFDISLVGNTTPLSASLSPAGDLLFVGANDGTVHVINTTSLADTEQVTFPFPQNSLCVGPGTPATQVETTLNITDVSQTSSKSTYTYDSLAGPALQTGEKIVVSGMSNVSNNGTFTINALGSGTFTVVNASGVTATGQSGTGISGTICLPDLVAAKP
jgi:WD40 repeat protein